MTLNSNSFLAKCEELKTKGVEIPIKTGSRVARGFADLGYEEFYLLPNNKLLSLYTGKMTTFEPVEEKFFFYVPGIEDLLDQLSRREEAVKSIEYTDNMWCIKTSKKEYQVDSLTEGVMDILFQACNE